MSKQTPESWYISECPDTNRRFLVAHGKDGNIAEVFGRDEALIVAGPELLAEVKAMHSELYGDCKGGCPTLALIARAEGRQL